MPEDVNRREVQVLRSAVAKVIRECQTTLEEVRENEVKRDELLEEEKRQIMLQMQKEFDSRVDVMVRKRARQLEKKGKRRNGKRIK